MSENIPVGILPDISTRTVHLKTRKLPNTRTRVPGTGTVILEYVYPGCLYRYVTTKVRKLNAKFSCARYPGVRVRVPGYVMRMFAS
jgi:hypothetical protein